MADKKNTFGKKLKDLFIVDEGDGAQDSTTTPPPAAPQAHATSEVDDLIARYAGPMASGPTKARAAAPVPPTPASAETAPAPVPGPPPVAAAAVAAADPSVPAAKVNFVEVFQKAGISSDEQARVERARQLLHNLPTDTPKQVKRQIVEASLAAFAIPVDQIIEAALLHQRALERHVDQGQLATQQKLDEANQRLKDLEKEAARLRQAMQEQFTGQQALANACSQQRFVVQEVLDFFGQEAVDRVTTTSAKLGGGKAKPGIPAR